MSVYNFFAGPAILAKEVLEKSQEAIADFAGMGLSILEISHRSKQFVEVLEKAEHGVRDLLDLPQEYAVLFLTGGASSQFFMTAMNILNQNEKAAFIDTGAWSSKSLKEAKLFGHIDVIASSKDKNYSYIPKKYKIDSGYKYLHITTNNTIFGTQFHKLPDTEVPIVADMSSDIFSRPIDIQRYNIVYAGAQKNLGPAGTTLVIVRKDIVDKVNRTLPTMLNYQTHINKNSAFNTPPVFPIYVSMLSLEWLKEKGGVKSIQKINEQKAKLLYDEIDRNPLFYGTAAKEDRSLMNVCFLPKDENHIPVFIEKATKAGCVGIKGHRSVGGFRASIYNAMPIEGVRHLVQVMQDFEKTYG